MSGIGPSISLLHQLTISKQPKSPNNPNPFKQKLHINLHSNSKYQATTAEDFIAKSKSHCYTPQLLTKATSTPWWYFTSNIKYPYLYKRMDWLQKALMLHKRSKTIWKKSFFPISNFDLKLGCRYCNGGWHWAFGERDLLFGYWDMSNLLNFFWQLRLWDGGTV